MTMRILSPTFILGAALVAGFATTALIAQDQSQPAASAQASSPDTQAQHVPNPQHQARKMTKELGLTANQESQVEPILANRDQQVQSARADTTMAPRDKRAKLHGINQDSDSQIETILNDTQKQQYMQMKENHKAAKQNQEQQQSSAPSTN
jgi:protein CpxP